MRPDDTDHAACVDAWMACGPRSVPPAELVAAFERAFTALWRRAEVTLGEITLTAIVDRVLYTTTKTYPFLAKLKVERSGVRFEELRSQGDAFHPARLPGAVRAVLVELLTVLGSLTGEIMTPALHSALAEVAVEEAARPCLGPRQGPREEATTAPMEQPREPEDDAE